MESLSYILWGWLVSSKLEVILARASIVVVVSVVRLRQEVRLKGAVSGHPRKH